MTVYLMPSVFFFFDPFSQEKIYLYPFVDILRISLKDMCLIGRRDIHIDELNLHKIRSEDEYRQCLTSID